MNSALLPIAQTTLDAAWQPAQAGRWQTGPVIRRSTSIRSIVVVSLLAAAVGGYALARSSLGATTHFRGRDFTDAGCHLDAASKRYRVPIHGWPRLQHGEIAVAVQTVATAFPTDVLVLRDGRCLNQWALEGGP